MRMLQADPASTDNRFSLGKTLAFAGYGLVFAWWTFVGFAIIFGWPAHDDARITFDHWEEFLKWGNGVLLAGFLLYGSKVVENVKKNGNGQ